MSQIVIISPSKFFGGGERFLEILCECYSEHQILVIANNKHLTDKLGLLGNVTIFDKSIYSLAYLQKLYSYNKSTFFFLNGLGENRKLAFILKLFKHNPIVICHSIEDWGSGYDKTLSQYLRSKINRFVYRNSKLIIGVSRIASENLRVNFNSNLIKYIPNTAGIGFDKDKFIKVQRSSLLNIGFVSRFSSEKGIDRFIRIVNMVLNRSVKSLNVKFVVAGSGPMLSEIEELQMQYPNNFEYLGFVDSNIVFSKINVLLITSNTESMPLVALEAMKYSLPIISTAVGGLKDLIIEGYNGYKFNLEEENELVDKLIELITDQKQLDLLGLNGSELYNKVYNYSHFCKAYNEIIQIS